MDSQELLQLVEKETVIEIMEDLGSPCAGMGTTSEGVSYLMFQTICHGGDSRDKLWWYENTKNFQCWTCCGNMSLYTLVMKVRNCTFKESFNYVATKVGVSTSDSNRYGIQDPKSVKNVRAEINEMDKLIEARGNKYTVQNITRFYDSKVLKLFDDNAFYQGWIDEGISEDTMRKFNISFYWLEGHIIIPHYDGEGRLVGIRRRSLNPEDAKNKYMPEYMNGIMYEHPLGLNFYGLYQNKEAIKKSKTAMIFEGEKSVMLSDTYYGDKSVALATCGFNISDWQIQALKQLGVNTVYLGFDKDFDIMREQEYKQDKSTWENYSHYKTRLETLAGRLAMRFKTYILYDRHNLLGLKDSPVDKGKESFEKLIKSAKLIKG